MEPVDRPKRVQWSSRLDQVVTWCMLVATFVLLGFAAKTFLFVAPKRRPAAEQTPPATPLNLAGAHRTGSVDAGVVLLMYSDFQCPACRKFARDVLPDIQESYIKVGRVQLAFRHFPVQALHPFAFAAAESAACAGMGGRFWQVHDLFFRRTELTSDSLPEDVAHAGVDAAQFTACMNAREGAGEVRQDLASGMELGVAVTPTVMVGRLESGNRVQVVRRINGAPSFDSLKQMLDAALNAPPTASRTR